MVVSDRNLAKPITSITTRILFITAIIVIVFAFLLFSPKITSGYFFVTASGSSSDEISAQPGPLPSSGEFNAPEISQSERTDTTSGPGAEISDIIILQPNGAGKDTCIISGSPNLNYGADTGMDIRGDDNRHSLIWFNLSDIPSNAIITSATLKLYATAKGSADAVVYIHKITNNWDEGTGNNNKTSDGATWNNATGTSLWTTSGGDYDSYIQTNTTVTGINQQFSWNVASLVQNLVNQTYADNYGFLLRTNTTSSGTTTFATSDNSNASRWPILEINYAIPDTTPPDISIISPQAAIYNNSMQLVNISTSDASNVWYNWNGINITYIGWPLTYVNFNEGSNILYAYANDSAGNQNSTSVTFTIHTMPPATVTNLQNQSAGETWLYWSWTNPSDLDFDQAIVYINGNNVANTSNNFYNATGLSENTEYTITVHTKDTSGNVNNTDVSSTAKTLAACIENWTVHYGDCMLADDHRLKSYIDENACGTANNLPGDNNTIVDCDYCTPTWENANSSCNADDTFDVGYYYTNDCCAQTGLPSDCNIPANTTGICDYCIPNWSPVNTTCQSNSQLTQYYVDSNNCYAQTGLSSDNNPPANNTYSCTYSTPASPKKSGGSNGGGGGSSNEIIENSTNQTTVITNIPSVESQLAENQQKLAASENSNESNVTLPFTGAIAQVMPLQGANPMFAIPSLLLLVLLFAILALNHEKLSSRVKKMLIRLHVALLITIVLLLVLTFFSSSLPSLSSLTGGVINIDVLQMHIQVSNLVLGLAMFLAGLASVILAWVFHHHRHIQAEQKSIKFKHKGKI